MTKTKRQLRAEAVERLKETRMDSGSAVKKLALALGSEWNPPSVNHSLECLKSRLIDLLTDDKLLFSNIFINGRNCIVIPAEYVTEGTTSIEVGEKRFVLADDKPPEGDAVSIMRDLRGSVDLPMLRDALCRETGTHDLTGALETLADMMERDYVRRENFTIICKALERVKAERDKLLEESEEFERIVDRLTAERDFWKDEADVLVKRIEQREDTMRRLAELVDVTPEAEHLYNGNPHLVIKHCDFGELATLTSMAVRRLISERDEWKARAESSSQGWARANAGWAEANGEAEAWRQKCDELKSKAERVDNGTCPDGNGTEAAGSVRQAELPDTDCGQGVEVDTRERDSQLPEGVEWPRFEDGEPVKPFDKVRGFDDMGVQKFIYTTSANGSWQLQDAEGNIFNVYPMVDGFNRVDRPPLMAADGQPIEVGQVLYGGDGRAWKVIAFDYANAPYVVVGTHERDGQREMKPEWLTHEPPVQPTQTVDDLHLAAQLGEALAEREEYRALAGKMLDAAQEIRRIADANMPEGGKEVM